MERISSVSDLLQFCASFSKELGVRGTFVERGSKSRDILVCGGTGCRAGDSASVAKALRAEIRSMGLHAQVRVIEVGCFGFCEKGPIVKIMPDKTFYIGVKTDDAFDILSQHIVNGVPLQRLLYVDPRSGESVPDSDHMSFYSKQQRIVLANCGAINPESIQEYIAVRGYQALSLVLSGEVDAIDCLTKAGLRGRGGGGFPTGVKWKIAAAAVSALMVKYVVCNADEGDPGAFMDRSIMEGDPHSVIEAMVICGRSIGAQHGLVYIRAEYPLAVHRLEVAIEQATDCGLLGDNILNSDFCFDIEIRYGAGAFVCGEEMALIHSMEGGRGEPTLKPPFPAEHGYMGYPTNVNNVETLAVIPKIILRGADYYAGIGTDKSKGTKVFALAGKINNVGLIEVPMGTTLREVIFEIGEGVAGGAEFKAVQTGGPSGGCLTLKHLDMQIDYDNLIAAGSMMGSGGMIVVDSHDCMVQMAKFYLEFTVEESCGKCSPCRIGTRRLLEILERIVGAKASLEDLERLEELCHVIKDTALCGLGQTAPNPVLSTLDNFRQEYIDHVVHKHCAAGKCKAMIVYSIDPQLCVGCTICARNCPVNAISGQARSIHTIDVDKCIRCGVCKAKCKFSAISTH